MPLCVVSLPPSHRLELFRFDARESDMRYYLMRCPLSAIGPTGKLGQWDRDTITHTHTHTPKCMLFFRPRIVLQDS